MFSSEAKLLLYVVTALAVSQSGACDHATGSCIPWVIDVLDKSCEVMSDRGETTSSIEKLLPEQAKSTLWADTCFQDPRGEQSVLSCESGEVPSYQGYSLSGLRTNTTDLLTCMVGGENAEPDITIDPYCEINEATMRCRVAKPGALRYTRMTYESLGDCESMSNATMVGDIVIEPVPVNSCPEGCVCYVSFDVETQKETHSVTCDGPHNSTYPQTALPFNPDDEHEPVSTRRLSGNSGTLCSVSGAMFVIFHCNFDASEDAGMSMASYFADNKCTIPIQSFAPMAPQMGMCYEKVNEGGVVSYEAIQVCKTLSHDTDITGFADEEGAANESDVAAAVAVGMMLFSAVLTL